MIFGHSCTSEHYWRVPMIQLKLGNTCLQIPPDGGRCHLRLYTCRWRNPAQSALCSVVLAGFSGVVAVATLVVLAGRLACYAEATGYVWPADAQRHSVIDERR